MGVLSSQSSPSLSSTMLAHSTLLLSLLALSLTGEIPVQDCGSKAVIAKIEFDGCDAFPCIVHHGTHATGKLYMTATSTASSLECTISGIILGGIELPFNGCPKNACDHLSQGDCPVEVGESLVYDMDLPIENFYPTIEILGRWKLFDDANEEFLCFEIPIKIEA